METTLQSKQLFQVIQSEELELFHINDLPEIDMSDLDNQEILNLCGRWVNHIARVQYVFHKFCQEIDGDINHVTSLSRVCCFIQGLNEEIYRIYEDLYDGINEVDDDLLFFIEKELDIRQRLLALEEEDKKITLREVTNIFCEILEELLKGFSKKPMGDGLEIKGWIRAVYRTVLDLKEGKEVSDTFEC